MEPATIDLIKTIMTDAIKILCPAGITAYVAYRTLKAQFDIEVLRLHDRDRIQAYKRLFVFSRKLRNQTFPLAENKRFAFIELMRKEYFGKVDIDIVYFPDEASKILDELEERYVCMTRGELIPEMDPKKEEDFIENKLYKLANNLSNHVRNALKPH